jgi:hypothetical protein
LCLPAPAFRLKGGGRYENDLKSGNKRNLVESGDTKPGDSPKMSDSGGAKPAEPRAESKPAPKAEPKGGTAD